MSEPCHTDGIIRRKHSKAGGAAFAVGSFWATTALSRPMDGARTAAAVKTCLLIVLGGLLLIGSSCREEKTALTTPRLIFNCDGTDLLGNYMFEGRPLSLANIHAYVDAYAQTPVTTFMMCSGAHNLYYRSAFTRVIGEAPKGFTPGTYEDVEDVAKYYRSFLNVEREGADVITAVLQRAQEHHLETFITYRMNDLHFNAPDQSPLSYCDFWKAHPEYWVNENTGWHTEGAFDFAHPEVRAFKMGIIAEQIDKYGHLIDGFDLDFMRFIVYFKTDEGAKNAPLMTELVRTVKQKIDETAQRTGRHILLSVRVPVELDFCLQKGLDVKEWVQQGLVDMITIGVHWCGHPAMPVEKFRNALGCDHVPVLATIDDGGFWPREPYSHGQRRGMAAHIHAQGGNGLYLFNHFIGGGYDGASSTGSLSLRTIEPMLHELGSTEKLRQRNKIFMLDDGAASAYGYVSDTPLPLLATKTNRATAALYVADNVLEDVPQEAFLFLRTDRPETLSVSVNEVRLCEQLPEYATLMDRDSKLSGTETVYAFRVPVSVLKQGDNWISITSMGDETRIKRIEIALKYGDVTTNGYF